MKLQDRTTRKYSATSCNYGANRARRLNSKKAAPKKARVSTSDAQEWTVGRTDLNTLRPIKDCQVRLPAGLPTDILAGGATTLTVGTKAGKTLSQPSAPVLREEFSQALRCLEKRVSQIEGLLSNFSPIVTDEVVTWTCPEDKHLSPELQKERRSGKETRRLHQERRRGQRRLRILPRRGSGPSPISGTPSAS